MDSYGQSRYQDRREAGKLLARKLQGYAGRDDVLVLALPRGGVPVGYEVALYLEAPLDVLVVRKLGVPGQEELAMGAISSGSGMVLNHNLIEQLGISNFRLQRIIDSEKRELLQRERKFRGTLPEPVVSGKTVFLVDDGLATGSSMIAAASSLRHHGPGKTVVAVPVAAAETCEALLEHADEVVCPFTPEPFIAVGLWYENFEQTSDEEVRQLLERARKAEAERGKRAAA